MSHPTWKLGALLGLGTLVAACGGGYSGNSAGYSSSTSSTSSSAASAASVSTVTTGAITGFGSVHVNGVHFETSSTEIHKSGDAITQEDLRVGQIVRIKGHVDDNGHGVAESIDFSNNVEGPIGSIDLAHSRFLVLGQTIIVDASTSFDDSLQPAALSALKVGDRVEVSGLTDSQGNVVASRIELSNSAITTVEVNGVISTLDTVAKTFKIGAQLVNYGGATLNHFGTGAPINGDQVEVHGTVNGSGVLVATRLEREADEQEFENSSASSSAASSASSSSSSSSRREIEGLITRFASTTDFDVAGRKVTTNSNTRYDNGTANELALDTRIEVEGSVNADGVLVADKVQFRLNGNVRLQASIDAIDATAGTVSILGVTVKVTAVTRYEDKSNAKIERFSLANLSAGDFVEIRAAYSNGVLTATRLERDKLQSTVELRGPVTSVASPQFSIAGITVSTSGTTKFEADDSTILTGTTFFANALGQSVGVKGSISGSTINATKVELRGTDE